MDIYHGCTRYSYGNALEMRDASNCRTAKGFPFSFYFGFDCKRKRYQKGTMQPCLHVWCNMLVPRMCSGWTFFCWKNMYFMVKIQAVGAIWQAEFKWEILNTTTPLQLRALIQRVGLLNEVTTHTHKMNLACVAVWLQCCSHSLVPWLMSVINVWKYHYVNLVRTGSIKPLLGRWLG